MSCRAEASKYQEVNVYFGTPKIDSTCAHLFNSVFAASQLYAKLLPVGHRKMSVNLDFCNQSA